MYDDGDDDDDDGGGDNIIACAHVFRKGVEFSSSGEIVQYQLNIGIDDRRDGWPKLATLDLNYGRPAAAAAAAISIISLGCLGFFFHTHSHLHTTYHHILHGAH
ncbi:acetyl-CoA C-acyltransferase [Trichinella spiralis]|uniref:acetyl-CoA C-acyltransferase n=1 Tax=Trichinella spiralis TaxID=6334 RepID=UPI0001EFEA50|nr:acetyl-CoA C-acyltransferase [Trichinella spiralis]